MIHHEVIVFIPVSPFCGIFSREETHRGSWHTALRAPSSGAAGLRGGSAAGGAAGGPHLWEGCVYHPRAGLQLLEHDDNKKPILQAL